MPQSMRALVAGKVGEPADVLRLESRPVPTPDAGQALIRVKATPIHASDLHVLRGRYGFFPEFPTVGGHMECVGRIEALGPDTEGLKIGERVVAAAVPAMPGPPQVAGTWQEYLVADTQRLLPVPDHLSDSRACQPPAEGESMKSELARVMYLVRRMLRGRWPSRLDPAERHHRHANRDAQLIHHYVPTRRL
ncbi:alcohol dehydrogenase catalytic domain-containing protein [Streptomyces kronopolitis]|uniref:alcohol dehydrogenase catalytic domain-containing protein n=1 Tax=Streptomyces kronopolitis TaxID=1612435 RepID=UPI0036B001DE